MATWFPALRFAWGKRILPHLPPQPLRVLSGAALTALALWFFFGFCTVVFQGSAYVISGAYNVALDIGEQTVATLQNIPRTIPPTLAPSATTAETAPFDEQPLQTPIILSTDLPSVAEQPPMNQTLNPSEPTTSPLPVPLYPLVAGTPVVREPIQPNALPYGERQPLMLPDIIRQIDYALYQVLLRLNLEYSRLELLQTLSQLHVDSKNKKQVGYFFQRFRAHLPGTVKSFTEEIRRSLEVWADETAIKTVKEQGRTILRISAQGVLTHELFLNPAGKTFIAPPLEGSPRLTIVIDDLGEQTEPVRQLLALDFPITFSLLPYAKHAGSIAKTVHAAGHEVLLHQPMEPMDIKNNPPGANALLMNMSEEGIRKTLRRNINILPLAVGINNHMGSRLTRDTNACRIIVDESATAGLFVLDSFTHPESRLLAVASQAELTSYRRDFFLDDKAPPRRAVLDTLRKAESQALRTGQAIVIGHPHAETIAALKEWALTRDTSIAITPLRYQLR